MTLLTDSALKISVILAIALLTATLLRNRSAAVRHWILTAAVLCGTVVPFAALVLPAWSLGPDIRRAIPLSLLSYTVPDQADANIASALGPPAARSSLLMVAAESLAIVWLAGSIVALLVLVTGFIRLTRVALPASEVTHGVWVQMAARISQRFALRRRVRLQQSESPAMLITWGVLRPRILLPQGAELWSEERISVVLHHELAHVQRNDWLFHTIAEMLRVVYWFNPFVWVVCRRLRLESEYAADDAVLAQGFSGPRYAAHLLDIVRTLQQPDRAWSAASAMARPSTIERRFSAMLNLAADRRPPSRLVVAVVGGLLLGTALSLAALSSAAPVPVVLPEAVVVAPPAEPAVVPVVVRPTRMQVSAARTQQPQAAAAAPLPATAYKGERISLDMRNTDFKAFFTMIGTFANLNVVVDPEVNGTLTIQVKDVPWDQVLDIVTRDRNLLAQLQGDVLRISSKPAVIPQGRVVLDFEVLKNGQVLGKPRIGTMEKVGATLSQGTDYTISITPTQVAANRVELNFEFVVGVEKFAGRGLLVTRDSPGKVLWKTAGDSFEITVSLPAAP